MTSLYKKFQEWLDGDSKVAIATVTKTWGSSPCPAGAQMAISDKGEYIGAVSAGCVETSVIDSSKTVFKTGASMVLDFKVSSEDAFTVGLACGGDLQILLQPFYGQGSQKQLLKCVLDKKTGYYLAKISRGADPLNDDIFLATSDELQSFLSSSGGGDKNRKQISTPELVDLPGKGEYFILPVFPPFHLIIIGAGQIAGCLTALAEQMEYELTVIDPRSALINAVNFSATTKRVPGWPQKILPELDLTPNTAVVTLSHDAKIDDPALIIALKSEVGYIGSLGSQKTHRRRLQRLRKLGFPPALLKKIHSPVGLKIGALNPAEIAVSILAEIVQFQRMNNDDA